MGNDAVRSAKPVFTVDRDYSRKVLREGNMTAAVERLAAQLQDAEAAHGEYERTMLHGARDEAWALWYARWLLTRRAYAMQEAIDLYLHEVGERLP